MPSFAVIGERPLPDSGHSAWCLAASLDNNCLRDSTIRICAANSR
jgi:hypothetical protein